VLKTNGMIATYSSDADPMPTIPFGQLLVKDVTVRFGLVYVMGDAAHQAATKDITSALEAGLLHPVAVQPSAWTRLPLHTRPWRQAIPRARC
jgi:NADPH:quinone reductase